MQDCKPVLLFVFCLLGLLTRPALADRIFTLCEVNSGYTAPNHDLLRKRPRGNVVSHSHWQLATTCGIPTRQDRNA
jgi:hypothetical protein